VALRIANDHWLNAESTKPARRISARLIALGCDRISHPLSRNYLLWRSVTRQDVIMDRHEQRRSALRHDEVDMRAIMLGTLPLCPGSSVHVDER
jgi:hypothetical protein